MDFKTKYGNERDVEIPRLLDFIRAHKDIKKVLDVGCARSFYIPLIKKMGKDVSCIDFEKDPKVEPFLTDYFLGDFLDETTVKYDLISAISVVEHYGIKHKPVENWQDKQIELVRKIGKLAVKYIFITFPFGALRVFPGEYAVVDDVLLAMFEDVLDDFELVKEFYLNAHPADDFLWQKVEQGVVDQCIHTQEKGVGCVCVLRGVRKDV